MRHLILPTCLALSVPTTVAHAHPHIFVSVEVAVTFSGNQPTEVELAWIYDDYFSLLLMTDLGLDLDADMILTPEEKDILAASVTEWPADFGGDLEVKQGDVLVSLQDRVNHTMEFENGIVREVHTRPLGPVADAPLTIRIFDPYYYVAYELIGSVSINGRDDCDALITPANLDEAYTLVEELLYGRPASDVGPEEEFPEVGEAFADTIEITCEASG